MPVLHYDRCNKRYYMTLSRRMMESLGYMNGDSLRLIRGHGEHAVYLRKDTSGAVSACRLNYQVANGIYKLTVPTSIAEFNGWKGGMWFGIMSHNGASGFSIFVGSSLYNRGLERVMINDIVRQAQKDGAGSYIVPTVEHTPRRKTPPPTTPT